MMERAPSPAVRKKVRGDILVALQMILETERLLLRPAQVADTDALFPLFNNWNVIQWLSGPPWPQRRENFMTWLRDNPMREAYYVLIRRADGMAMGGISHRAAGRRRPEGLYPDIGYWLGEPYWNQGFMTEAARAIVAHLFADPAHDAIDCGAFVGNHGSLRIQEKLGFEFVEQNALFSNPKQQTLPHISTRLARSRFKALNPAPTK